MDPLIIAYPPPDDPTHVQTPDYEGPAYVVTVLIPTSRVGDIDRNDTNRREVTAKIAAVLPSKQPL